MTSPLKETLTHKDLLTIAAYSHADISRIFEYADILKRQRTTHTDLLQNKRLVLIFEKDSLRTRFTFDIGMQDLGGSAVFMDHRDARLGSRESVPDIAHNLERWAHGVVVRTFKQRTIEELAANCSIPVINGLSDLLHPCQALADLFTLSEKFGDVRGRRVCYVGDGNNTCHSLILAASKLGANLTVCTPEGYEPNSRIVSEAMLFARESNAEIRIMNDVDEAAEGADAIYTDVWASMGQEDETEERAAAFADYRVDEHLMARAAPQAVFMHCLPAHRGAEVSSSVIDGPQSIVFDIAENRLHVQKAILVLLLGQARPTS